MHNMSTAMLSSHRGQCDACMISCLASRRIAPHARINASIIERLLCLQASLGASELEEVDCVNALRAQRRQLQAGTAAEQNAAGSSQTFPAGTAQEVSPLLSKKFGLLL